MSPLDYLKKRIKESKTWYQAGGEKRAHIAIQKLLNGNPSEESIRKAAFTLGWRNHSPQCTNYQRWYCRGECLKENL